MVNRGLWTTRTSKALIASIPPELSPLRNWFKEWDPPASWFLCGCRFPGLRTPRIRGVLISQVYRIAIMWSFSLRYPEYTSLLWRLLSTAPCLDDFGIYLVNPQHKQCAAVYTSGRTSSFQLHMEFPWSFSISYRSSGTAKPLACLPSVQVPYLVCCIPDLYNTLLIEAFWAEMRIPMEIAFWISMTYDAHPYP